MLLAVRADNINADTPVFTANQVVAPEQLLGHPWSCPVDVWALGVNVSAPMRSWQKADTHLDVPDAHGVGSV